MDVNSHYPMSGEKFTYNFISNEITSLVFTHFQLLDMNMIRGLMVDCLSKSLLVKGERGTANEAECNFD